MYIQASIPQLAEQFPDSLAASFRFKNLNPNHYYFKVNDAKFTPKDSVFVSFVECVVFRQDTGDLYLEVVKIPRGQELEAISIKEFYNRVMIKYAELIADKNPYPEKMYRMYKALEFIK